MACLSPLRPNGSSITLITTRPLQCRVSPPSLLLVSSSTSTETDPDRFDLIVVPFLAKLAKIYETNPIPDLISISTGFWGITRMVEADDSIQRALIASGETNLEKLSKFDALAEMTRERKDFIEEKIISLIEHIADAWPVVHSSTPSGENIQAPKILWREFSLFLSLSRERDLYDRTDKVHRGITSY